MADPKLNMLTDEELAGLIDAHTARLHSHIAALNARIAKLEAAGDALVDLPIDRDAPKQQGLTVHRCLACGTSWTPATAPRHHKEFHIGACPVSAWRAVRENADG